MTGTSLSPPLSPKRRWGPTLKRLAGGATLVYAAVCALVWAMQDSLLFHPRGVSDSLDARIRREGGQDLVLTRDGFTLRGYFMPGAGAGRRPVVLYFGGNAENVAARTIEVDLLIRRGVSFAVMPYRGYGRSEGSPSGATILDDALAFYDLVRVRDDVDPQRIVVWGLSLGTGPAQRIASERAVAGAILLAPYARLSDAAAHRFGFLPVRWLFRHEIAPIAWAGAQRIPVLVLHGTRDATIPVEQSDELAAAWAGDVNYQRLPGYGHADLETWPAFEATFFAFLDRVLAR